MKLQGLEFTYFGPMPTIPGNLLSCLAWARLSAIQMPKVVKMDHAIAKLAGYQGTIWWFEGRVEIDSCGQCFRIVPPKRGSKERTMRTGGVKRSEMVSIF